MRSLGVSAGAGRQPSGSRAGSHKRTRTADARGQRSACLIGCVPDGGRAKPPRSGWQDDQIRTGRVRPDRVGRAPAGSGREARRDGRGRQQGMPPETKERVTVAAGDRPLPPGQHVPRVWPALHYGRVPAFRPGRWNLRVFGATEDGADHRWPWAGFCALPRTRVVADFHCVTKVTIPDVVWDGVPATALLSLAPPAPSVTHVMIWAEYEYSANL